MAWFKVDDSMPFNTKTLMCSLEAIGLWVLAGAWASQQLTNGQVPKQVLPALRANEDVAAELVQAGLWIEDKENSKYHFHDWEKYNPTSEEVLNLRAKRAEAGRKGGIASAVAKRQASAKQAPEQNESKVQPRPVPSRPDPSPIHNQSNDEKFQEFWDAYPKQTGRPKALTEWHRAVTQGIAPDVLTAKARNYADQVSHEQREARFVKAPSNWLRDGDYHNTWKPSQPPMTAEQRRMANLPIAVPGEFY